MTSPSSPSAPAPPRFCYFVQCHRAPAQIARLVATLKRLSPHAHVLVGHDARRTPLERAALPDLPGVDLFTVRGPVERGELTLLAPYLQALEHLTATGIEYDWLVYLSGQDYPTKRLAESESELARSGKDGFLLWWEAFLPVNPWGRKRTGKLRYLYRYFRPPAWLEPLLKPLRLLNGAQSLLHVHQTYGMHVGFRTHRHPFRDGFVCYAGTQWTTLSRPCVDYLTEAFGARRDLVAHYERTICSDESIVQTLLVNAGRFRLGNDSLRFVDMRGSRTGSPRTLTATDFDELTSGRYHFARKFEPAIDAAILDRLDAYLFAR